MKQQLKIVVVSLFFVFFTVEAAPEVEALKRYLRYNGRAGDGYDRPDADSEKRNEVSLANNLVFAWAYAIKYQYYCEWPVAETSFLFLETMIVHPEVFNREMKVSSYQDKLCYCSTAF